jgi:hypothetical protein
MRAGRALNSVKEIFARSARCFMVVNWPLVYIHHTSPNKTKCHIKFENLFIRKIPLRGTLKGRNIHSKGGSSCSSSSSSLSYPKPNQPTRASRVHIAAVRFNLKIYKGGCISRKTHPHPSTQHSFTQHLEDWWLVAVVGWSHNWGTATHECFASLSSSAMCFCHL